MKEIKMTFIEHLEELRKRILWSLAAILICFIVAYNFSKKIFDFIAAPPAFKFLLSEYTSEHVKAFPTIGEALSFFMALIFGFGLVFEFPLIVFVLAKLGIVNSNMLKRKRRYAIVICAIAAAIITPTTDAFSMVLMLVPLIVKASV